MRDAIATSLTSTEGLSLLHVDVDEKGPLARVVHMQRLIIVLEYVLKAATLLQQEVLKGSGMFRESFLSCQG